MKTIVCVGCQGEFVDIGGPTHRYMKSCPGCWAAFGEVLAREYSNPHYFEVHRLTVDAYAVQHPGIPSSQSIYSIGAHLIRLCFFFEQALSAQQANDAMLRATKLKHKFVWLEPPVSLGDLTVVDVVKTKTVVEHKNSVRAWARGAWDAWLPYHDTVRSWLNK